METHHPHHPAHKKKWTEYLLEFFMLFFAVFLGFIAENIRENIVENKRSKEFAVSLLQDIKRDTAGLQRLIRFRTEKNKRTDSLVNILSEPLNGQYDSLLNRLTYRLIWRDYFVVTDATWQQVKSSGALRYIKRDVADSLVRYETEISELLRSENTEATEIRDVTSTLYTIINADYMYARKMNRPGGGFKVFRIKEDPGARNILFNWALHFLRVSEGMMIRHRQILAEANNLIAVIKKEYHLENE